MRVSEQYPAPVHGVSTLAARNRNAGQAEIQENFRSDPAVKLTKRPSSTWEQVLLEGYGAKTLKYHEYRRKGKFFQMLITNEGNVYPFVDGIAKAVTGDLSTYMTGYNNIAVKTINDTTFVCDKTIPTAMLGDTDYTADNVRRIHHINIAKALDYSEVLTVTITDRNTAVSITSTITIPNLNPTVPGLADAYRGTGKVATALAADIISVAAGVSFPITVVTAGSTVAFWHSTDDDYFDVTVKADQGKDSVINISEVTDRVDGLPAWGVPKAVVRIEQDPATNKATYYIKSEAIGTEVAYPAPAIQEIVWKETRNPNEPYAFDELTFPHTILYDEALDEFTVGVAVAGWEDRLVGDDESNKRPDFVGAPIEGLGHFQNRLVFLSDNELYMSETDDLYNWWKQSAIQLLLTDPVGLASNAEGVDGLKHVIGHNRDMMVVAGNGQFKVSGDVAVSPQTVSMTMTTAYACQTSVPPVGIGNAVYLPVSYGNSSGLSAYTGEPNTSQDSAQPITAHVAGYMPGDVTILTASSNLEILVMKTDGAADNEFFVLEQARATNGVLQQLAWCKWILPEATNIITITLDNDVMNIICLEGLNIVYKKLQLFSAIAEDNTTVFLDDKLTLTSDGTTVTVPDNYDLTGAIVVTGNDTDYPLWKVNYTAIGTTLTLEEAVSSTPCTIYVGKPFTAKYRPTRPFLYDKETGKPNTFDRLRVNRFVLSLNNTHSISAHIESEYNTSYVDQVFVSRETGNINSIIGEKTFYTGDVTFSYAQEAAEATMEFYDSGYLNVTITGIGWKGQLYKSSRGI